MNFNQLRNQGVLLSLVFIAFYLISSVVWYMNTDAPWDDDCVARYFNCLKAPENPANFVSLWNRPLFMVIFTYPYVWFGKSAILLMPLLSAISAWLLYKALDKIKVPHAWIVVPFLLMQSFYFVISGSALSEPLASFLIALGFYLLVNKRFLWFAVVGSLLPLARLELSLLLGIWGLILIVEKKLKYLPLLITGVVLWNTAAGIITGDWAFLYSATLGNGQDSNRYGHQTFGHYFQRLIYVVGPVVFYFLLFGLVGTSRKLKEHLFTTVQFALGFMIYVVFSWKLNLGQAAGFLRHLIALSPLVAIIAVYGFNFILESVASVQEKEAAKRSVNLILARLTVYILPLVLIFVSLSFFSKEILSHHKIGEEAFWGNTLVITGLYLFFVVVSFVPIKSALKVATGVLLGLIVSGYTLMTEDPDSHNSPERTLLTDVANQYKLLFDEGTETYVNHPWFFWANNKDPRSEEFKGVKWENLDSAETGSVVIWENHYSHRLHGDVQLKEIQNNKDYVEVQRMTSTDNRFMSAIFMNIKGLSEEGILEKYDALIDRDTTIISTLLLRGNYRFNALKDYKGAIEDYERIITLDSTYSDAYMNMGYAYLNLRQNEKGFEYLKLAAKNGAKDYKVYFQLGMMETQMKNFDQGVKYFTKAISLNKKDDLSAFNRGVAYVNMNELEKAMIDFSAVINFKANNIPQAYYNRAVCKIKLNQRDQACPDLAQSAKLGFEQAAAVFQQMCGK